MKRVAVLLAILIASTLGVMLARTLAAGKAPSMTRLTFSVPAPDVSLAATHLGEALRFETVSYDEGSNIEAFGKFRAWLIGTYPRFHATTHRTLVGGTLIHEWRGTNPSLPPVVLMAHQDVVPVPQPERWRHPPFSGAIADGAIWGRGALDNKGPLIAILEAAESLLAAGHAPARTVYFVFGHDEESGGSGARAAAELLASRGIRAAFVFDEGGLSLRDAPVVNGPMTLIGVAEKGAVTLQLEVRAAGGHSSSPGPKTAVDILARALVAIRASPFPLEYSGVTRDMLEAMAPHAPFQTRLAIANAWAFEPLLVRQIGASPQGAATLQTTIAPTMLQGSPKSNVLPSIATATINLRILPGESVAGAVAHVRASLGELPVTVRTVGPSMDPSPIASRESGGYRLVAGLAAQHFDAPIAPLLLIGATDSRHMRAISDDIYRYTPMMLGSTDIAIIHGFDEKVSIENFTHMLTFYEQLLVGGTAASLP